jgi:hypothetical protein
MLAFQLNLLRNETLPTEKRRALFLVMSLYLVVCGVLLVYAASRATHRLIAASKLRAEIADVEENIRSSHPGEKDVLPYSRLLKQEMTECADRLDGIAEVLKARVGLAGIIRNLAMPLPKGVHIVNLSLDGAKQELTFDVVVPIVGSTANVNAGQLVASWNTDTALMARISRIRSVVSQRYEMDERPVFVLRFTCMLAGREA